MTSFILPNPKDSEHKAWLYRVLIGIYDNPALSEVLYFKGGTCAAMLGLLERFSVDLDFDYVGESVDLLKIRALLEAVFEDLGLVISDQSKVVPQYFLKYKSLSGKRNTIKIDVTVPPPMSNIYETKRFSEIDRIITCQSTETMVANKLVALMDRFEKSGTIAGRDLYDIHHFFMKGYRYNEKIIRERTGLDTKQFLPKLINFVQKNITTKILNQDLNTLLPYDQFNRIRKTLKLETLVLLRDEQKRLEAV
jgi:predicted nucleotidyltransferase component of viral defense system